ncbi:MAG: sigma-70 family RNA polymerase sigma factor [Acidobacteriota bacterium]|nr:sigma-70 family RNA polymerase sigma factor [Acidobacteriota bacterium]
MGAAERSVLSRWGDLRRRLGPSLRAGDARRGAAVWTIGSAADAAAMSIICRASAPTGSPPAERCSVFLADDPGRDPVHYSPAEVRPLPSEVRSQWLSRANRKWFPKPCATSSVILEAPPSPVDLLVLRRVGLSGDPVPRSRVDAALRGVRVGGMVYWVDGAPQWVKHHPDLAPATSDYRLMARVDGRPVPPDPAGSPVGPPLTLEAKERADRLVESHFSLAVSLAHRYARSRDHSEDLEQVALLALVAAARRYRPDSNASFATYATVSVIGEIKRYFRDRTWMLRVPRPLKDAYLSVREASEALTHQLGASPTVDQIASYLSMTVEEVHAAMEAGDSYWPATLDRSSADDDHPVEIAVEDHRFEASLDLHQLQLAAPHLSPIEKLVLKRIFFDGRTQREVADELQTNQMHVSRVMSGAIGRMRSSFLAS